MHNFKNIIAWQKSRELVKDIYMLTAKFPKEEVYGLTSQIKRASVSVPSNIAEGTARTDKDFSRFLDIAIGSSFELETQLILSNDLGFISDELLNSTSLKVLEVQKVIYGFQKNLKTN